MPTRRTVLGTLGTGVVGAVAGRGRHDSTGEDVALEIANNGDRALDIYVRIVPADVSSGLSEDTLFERGFDFGPPNSEAASEVVPDAFESQKPLVRVGNQTGIFNEYTFVPDCSGADAQSDELRINVTGSSTAVFDQKVCQ